MSSPIRVGLIGTGLSTRVFHAPFLQSLPDLFFLQAVVERKASPTSSVTRQLYGDSVKVFTSVAELVMSKEIDLLIVNSPNSTHYEYCKLALENDLHVACEKPLCPTSTQAFELCLLAASKGLVLAPFQNRRWDSDFLTLRRLFEAGTFGDVSDFTTTFDRFKPSLKNDGNWKEVAGVGQGMLFDLGSHLIDQVLTLFGTPSSVTAIVHNARVQGPADLDDCFIVLLHYPSSESRKVPLTVTARTTMMSAVDPQLRYEMRGTKASFIKRGVDPQEDQLDADAHAIADASFGVEDPSIAASLTLVMPEGLKEQKVTSEKGDYRGWFRNVAAAVNGGGVQALTVKPEEGAEVIRILEFAQLSAKERRTVDIPPRP